MTPLAFFAYNRPEHTDRALQALAENKLQHNLKFYFFSDGPRRAENGPEVEATRKVLKKWAPHFNAEIVERSENLGLARSIVSGTSWLCEHYGRVIVVEDDLIVEAGFLHYMQQSLSRYETCEEVMQIGGCSLVSPTLTGIDAYFLPVTTTWGWATWQRAWKHFSWEPKNLAAISRDPNWESVFTVNGAYPYTRILEDRISGRNDSWGILWWYAVSTLGGLTLYPSRNLVTNKGFDGSGTHCKKETLFPNRKSHKVAALLEDEWSFPERPVCDPAHVTQLESFLRRQHTTPHPVSLLNRLTHLADSLKKRIST